MIRRSYRLAGSLALVLALVMAAGPAFGQIFIQPGAGKEIALEPTRPGAQRGASGVAAMWTGRMETEHLAMRADCQLRDGTVLRFAVVLAGGKELDLGSAKTELGSAYLHLDSTRDAGSAAFPLGRLATLRVYHNQVLILQGTVN